MTAGAGLVLAYGWGREKEPKRLRSLFFASLVTAVLYAPWLPTLATVALVELQSALES